jgi:hypothetical protein
VSIAYTLAIHFREIAADVDAGGRGIVASLYFIVKSPLFWFCFIIYILCYWKELKQWYGFPEFKIKNVFMQSIKNMVTPAYLKMLAVIFIVILILYMLTRIF